MKIYSKFTVDNACKNFKTSQYLAKLKARKPIVSCTLCALSCWKTKNLPDILSMTDVNCFKVDFNLAYIIIKLV